MVHSLKVDLHKPRVLDDFATVASKKVFVASEVSVRRGTFHCLPLPGYVIPIQHGLFDVINYQLHPTQRHPYKRFPTEFPMSASAPGRQLIRLQATKVNILFQTVRLQIKSNQMVYSNKGPKKGKH